MSRPLWIVLAATLLLAYVMLLPEPRSAPIPLACLDALDARMPMPANCLQGAE